VKVLTATKFKERCLALLDNVDPEGIVITKHGKPVAKLVPIEWSQARAGCLSVQRRQLLAKSQVLKQRRRSVGIDHSQ